MPTRIFYAVPVDWRREKYAFLDKAGSVAGVKWRALKPDTRGNWLRNLIIRSLPELKFP